MSFAKPENALQRAQELLAVSPNQRDEALKQLRTVITSRRHRTWQKSLEDLMVLYITLCVQLRKGKEAKDGLHQYRGICQQVNVASLGHVIKHFLEQAEQHAKEAQSKAEKITLDIEDLDAEEAPESLMLGKVSGEDTKDRTDRQIVTPWLKFLWETYRTVLDILRNNAKLETLYHYTAQQAFSFCKKYKRNTEFRRLSEILRGHVTNLSKSTQMTNAVSLTSPESLAFHLETRFSQLNVACELELWQEAFRSIEDLHALMSMAKKPPKPQLLANYYDKLARVFLVSENYTLHAYAWYKYYTLSKNQNKNLSADDLKQMASNVVVAALCIPVETGEISEELGGAELDGSQREKVNRLASLLGPGTAPSRESLLSELAVRGINSAVVPELADIYSLAEKSFQPLSYCENLKPKLEFIASQPSLKHYVGPLQHNLFIRLLQQIARVYGTIKIAHVAQLAYFMDAREVERRVVEAVRAGYVRAKIDHQNKTLNFTSDGPAGPDALRGQLRTLSRSLAQVANLIHPTREAERTERKKELFAATLKTIGDEHTRILERRRIIERRKEIREQMANLRAAAAAAAARKVDEERRAVEAAERAEALKKRAEEDRKKREEEMERNRIKRELESLSKIAKDSVTITEELLQRVDEEKGDASKVLESKKAELKRAKKDAETKLNNLAKNLDHLERALREEERPLLEQFYNALQQEDKTAYEAQVAAYRESQEKVHAKEVEEKRRLIRMNPDRSTFEERILQRRSEEYNRLKAAQDERLVVIRAQLEKEKEQRKKEMEERKRKAEEKERLRREEDEKRKKLEEERRRREEEAAAEERRAEEEREREEEQRARREEATRREEEETRRRDDDKRREVDERRREPAGREPAGREEEGAGAGWRRGPAARRGDEDRRPAPGRRDEEWGGRREPEGRPAGAYVPPGQRGGPRGPPARGAGREEDEERGGGWGRRGGDGARGRDYDDRDREGDRRGGYERDERDRRAGPASREGAPGAREEWRGGARGERGGDERRGDYGREREGGAGDAWRRPGGRDERGRDERPAGRGGPAYRDERDRERDSPSRPSPEREREGGSESGGGRGDGWETVRKGAVRRPAGRGN